MFDGLILTALRGGRKTTKDLYRLAEARQPESCRTGPCTHHRIVQDPQPEWCHQLRRDQQALKKDGKIRRVGDEWELA